MRVGIVAGEFDEPGVTRRGGFGWAARRAAEVLGDAGDDVVFVCPDAEALERTPTSIGGVPLVARRGGPWAFAGAVRARRPDVLLSIDYRPAYDTAFKALPRTPVVVWARDPRTPADAQAVAGTRVPGRPRDELPQGTAAIDCRSLRAVVRRSRLLRRRLRFASPAPGALAPKTAAAFGHDPGVLALLPNPVDVARDPEPEAERPAVVFLGRLDPVKRPWLFVELARSFPEVEFTMLGGAHFHGAGAWEPAGLPANVRLPGHAAGEEKARALDRAWVLVNTSVHEALAVSVLEALAARTPVLACTDTDGVASRFGVFAGRFGGDGLAALPSLRDGLRRLLEQHELRHRLGHEGRAWVCSRHTPERFLAEWRSLVAA